ncbi:CHASE2 domain-containing protein [candidate division GN15 bacterium]|nr:CHASE2 domain-containing protein [candidate division GN15 bacterium]
MAKYSSYILYLLITIFVVILYANGVGPLDSLQRSVNDFLMAVTAPDSHSSKVVLVTIDDEAREEYGEWPWNRDRIADLAAATAAGEPKVLVLNVDLYEDASQDSAGYTEILAGQFSWMNNVVLPYDIALATYRSSLTSNPQYLFNNAVVVNNPLGIMDEQSSLLARKVFLPAEKLLAAHTYLGFNYESPDKDRILRRSPLLVNYEGFYYPSLPLVATALYLGVSPELITVDEGERVSIGSKRDIPINEQGELYLTFADGKPFTTYSATDILDEDFDRERLKDKLVMISIDDPSREERFETPVSDRTRAAEVKATAIANILDKRFTIPHTNAAMLDMLVLFLLGGLFAFILPRVSLMYRMVVLVGALVLLANVNYLVLTSLSAIYNTVYLALQMVLFMVASPLLESELLAGERPARSSKAKKPARMVETKETVGHSDSGKVRHLESGPFDPHNVDTAAMDYGEKPPTFDDYQMLKLDETPPELSESQKQAQTSASEIDETPPALRDSGPVGGSSSDEIKIPETVDQFQESGEIDRSGSMTDSQKVELQRQAPDVRNLGRYQVTGIVGKGAMGLVYKGIDPAINRPVALKTIRLDFVSDAEEMAELKERLHREAQAAGKLSHPNIVTIYDVGSEGPLQYIAMEYLEGVTLEDLIRKKTKFNYRIISQIILQICNALDYAHEQGIVHRDIKPANIMILSDYRVKVMDYGIARVDSNSMTKTGIAMGTPNYISPEQLKGMAIDRRADLFSLGVVIYEMLLGRRPFKGENITSLIYSIMNHEPEKPSEVNPQVPLLFDHIIAKALKKDPPARYQRAAELANDMKDFVESFASR